MTAEMYRKQQRLSKFKYNSLKRQYLNRTDMLSVFFATFGSDVAYFTNDTVVSLTSTFNYQVKISAKFYVAKMYE